MGKWADAFDEAVKLMEKHPRLDAREAVNMGLNIVQTGDKREPGFLDPKQHAAPDEWCERCHEKMEARHFACATCFYIDPMKRIAFNKRIRT